MSTAPSTGYEPTEVNLRTVVFSGKDRDWSDWKFRFRAILSNKKLLETLDATSQEDKDKNAALYYMIASSIVGDAIGVVRRVPEGEGKQAWLALCSRYESNTQIRKDQLLHQLFSRDLVIKPNEQLETYLDRILEIRRQLESVNEKISDGVILGVIKEGLPWKDWKPLLTSIQLEDLDFEKQLDHMKAFDQQLISREKTSRSRDQPTTVDVALRANVTCNYCHRRGHTKADCFRLKTQNSQGNPRQKEYSTNAPTVSNKQCSYCGLRNHTVDDCRFKQRGQQPPVYGSHQTQSNQSHSAPQYNRKQHEKSREVHSDTDDSSEQLFLAKSDPDDASEHLFLGGQHRRKLSKPIWIVDSGATSHMTPANSNISDYVKQGSAISIANGDQLPVQGTGTVKLTTSDGINVKLTRVLHIPGVKDNLFSVAKANDAGHEVIFSPTESYIKCKDGNTIPIIRRSNYYVIDTDNRESAKTSQAIEDFKRWHQRLGHANKDSVRHVLNSKGITCSVSELPFCEICAIAKSHRQPYKGILRTASQPGEVVFTDLTGPVETQSIGGKRYACIFVDSATGMKFVYPIRQKSDALTAFRRCLLEFTSRGFTIQQLHSDRGGEFKSNEFSEFCLLHNIKQSFTAPYSPQQNGVAERAWRSLFECSRCLLLESGSPKSLWAAALDTASYIINRLPSSTNPDRKSPFELFYGKEPQIDHLRVFGCPAYVHDETYQGKLSPKSEKGKFIGYERDSKAYIILMPNGKVKTSHNVTFDESNQSVISDEINPTNISTNISVHDDTDMDIPEQPTDNNNDQPNQIVLEHPEDSLKDPFNPKHVQSTIQPDQIEHPTEPSNQSVPDPETQTKSAKWRNDPTHPDAFKTHPVPDVTLQRVDRVRKAPKRFDDDSANVICEIPPEPLTFAQAMKTPEANHWKSACEDEISVLSRKWELVDKPPDRKIIGCKWVFKRKLDGNGKISRYRSRLVVKGYNQIPGEDYRESFAPVAKIATLRTLLAAATHLDWDVYNSDISNAYLNAPLTEATYMTQPDGFNDGSGKVIKLNYSLYGLCQAGHNWNQHINTWLTTIGFLRSKADPCLYTTTRNGRPLSLVIYVDDLIYAGDATTVKWFQEEIDKKYKAKHEGEVKWILGMKIIRNRQQRTMEITQERKVLDLLHKYQLETSKVSPIPLPAGTVLTKNPTTNTDESFVKRYSELVGSLMHLATHTRPDLAHSVSMLCRHMSNPTIQHWNAAMQVLRYLKGTSKIGLNYSGNQDQRLSLHGFVDADYAGCPDTRKSTTGYVFFINSSIISWSSTLQPVIATSSTYAEYIAMSVAAQECKFLREVLNHLGLGSTEPTKIREDNQSAIFLADNPAYHKRSKHIDVRFHYVRECVDNGTIQLVYCPTTEMIADIFTKQLPQPKFNYYRQQLLGQHAL
jgi:transposase InsO family protein